MNGIVNDRRPLAVDWRLLSIVPDFVLMAVNGKEGRGVFSAWCVPAADGKGGKWALSWQV
jgi:hypothetical protein